MVTIPFGTLGARITVDRRTVPVWRAVEAIMAKHRYPIRKVDTGAYNCRQITGGSGYSLHAYGIAVDVNWSTNPYGPNLVTDMPPAMIREIEAIRPRNPIFRTRPAVRWGGRYTSNKDAMHFEVVVPPAALGMGVTGTPKKEMFTVSQFKDLMKAIKSRAGSTQVQRVNARLDRQGKLLADIGRKVGANTGLIQAVADDVDSLQEYLGDDDPEV
jgi:hypothetical protein